MTITSSEILDLAKGEIARVAASAYTEDGISMYDAIRPVSRDSALLQSYYDGALAYMNARLKGRAVSGEQVMLPFADSIASETDITPLVNNFMVSYICAEWFRRKYPVKNEEYAAKATASLEQLVILAKTRKQPTKGGITL